MNFSLVHLFRAYTHKYNYASEYNFTGITLTLDTEYNSSRDHFVEFISVKRTKVENHCLNTRIALCLWRARVYTPSLTYPVLILRNPHLSSLSLTVSLSLPCHSCLSRSPARIHAFPLFFPSRAYRSVLSLSLGSAL